MRGFRGGIGHIGASIGALLSGVLSFKVPGMGDFFAAQALNTPTPFRSARSTRVVKRRPARVHRGWTPNYYGVAGPDSREAERRRRQITAGSLRVANGLVSE